ncbi:MAG: S41 family peptidase [Bacteroidota bacterium]|nr:S41 family peptidase [Bacteroidota bacterium]
MNLLRKIVLVICLCFAIIGKAQIDTSILSKQYSVKQLREDLDFLEKRLTKFHPDPYHYISKDSLHLFVEEIKKQITAPLNEFQFRFLTRQIVAKIGCGHTVVSASKKYIKAVDKYNRPVFPVDVWLLDTNRIFVRDYLLNDSLLKKGDEILSIDGRSSIEIMKRVKSCFASDGFNETYKKQNLQRDRFRYFYASAYSYKTTYKVEVQTLHGETKIVELKCMYSGVDTMKIILPHDTTIIYRNTRAIFKKDPTDKSIAIIDINNFLGKKWRKFTRKTFKYLKKHPEVTNLVIDLRDNGGGRVSKGTYLMKYLIDKPFSYSFGRKPNLLVLDPRIKINVFSRLTNFGFLFCLPSHVKKGKWMHLFFSLPKKRKGFKGKIFVLTNGRSFSMSGMASSYLKYKANATIIGEETGGTLTGSNAMLSGTVVLPNTKTQIIVPLYHIHHQVKVPDTKRGLMPDFPVQYGIDDLLKKKDLEMEKVRELIKK